jgi:hypothetical protein
MRLSRNASVVFLLNLAAKQTVSAIDPNSTSINPPDTKPMGPSGNSSLLISDSSYINPSIVTEAWLSWDPHLGMPKSKVALPPKDNSDPIVNVNASSFYNSSSNSDPIWHKTNIPSNFTMYTRHWHQMIEFPDITNTTRATCWNQRNVVTADAKRAIPHVCRDLKFRIPYSEGFGGQMELPLSGSTQRSIYIGGTANAHPLGWKMDPKYCHRIANKIATECTDPETGNFMGGGIREKGRGYMIMLAQCTHEQPIENLPDESFSPLGVKLMRHAC